MRVLVLAGGPSSEREVSLQSGRAVASACTNLGHVVLEADVLPDRLEPLDQPCDIAFPVIHGTFGEDGTLQTLLEDRGIHYVGSGPEASRLCMDKNAAKEHWRAAGLPTAEWLCLDRGDADLADTFAVPAVVKPVADGSSVGVIMCDSKDKLKRTVTESLQHFPQVMIEKHLTGNELTVGILGNSALPIIEVQPAIGFYDYAAKYQRDDTNYILNPEIDPSLYRQLQQLALTAYRNLGCRHYGRVDLIIDEVCGPQLLEVNTIPGFTEHSLLPKAAAKQGLSFDALVQTLISTALDATT